MNFSGKIKKEEYNNQNYIDNKINELVKNCSLDLNYKEELYERTLILNFLNKDAKVLEIGGGLGHVSNAISNHLNNKENLVVIEPNEDKANKLKEEYKVFNGIISNEKQWFIREEGKKGKKKNFYVTVTDKNMKKEDINDSIEINNVTNIKNLEKKFNIKFDTLIVDCEGALPQIMEDNPELYNQINMIIIEYDWYINDCTKWRNKMLKNHNFKSLFSLPLHWNPCKGKGAFNNENKIIGHEVLIKNK